MKHLLLNEHLKSLFGERVQKLPVDPGFICPNRSGGKDGCIFCDDAGSAATWLQKGMSIAEQLKKSAGIAQRRYNTKKYIVYFQAYTSTASDPQTLRKMYDQALLFPGVVGIAISTRPDAISDDVLKLIKEYSQKTHLWVELGAQSMHQKSLEWMKRGHDVNVFTDAVKRLKNEKINVVGHIIFGLPTETKQEIMESFKLFLDTGINGYKIHALHIIKGTPLHERYIKDKFKLLEMDEYIELVRNALSVTPYGVVIHRLTGEVSEERLVAPKWVLNKNEILRRALA
ncbi:MAG: TIGR01212 family radical SAM protein [Pseudomonadota bacterium]